MISRTVDHSGPLFLISSLFPLLSSGTVDHSGPLFLLLLPSSLSGFQEQSIIPVHSSCYPLPLLEFLNSRSFRSTLQNSFLFPLFLSLLLSSRILLCGTLAHSPFYFISLHFFKKDYSLSSSLLCPHGFQQFLPSISPQFLPTIFSLISTDLHRSSQVYLAIQPLFICHFLLGTQSPRSSQIFTNLPQIFQRSFKIFLPPSLFTRYLDSRSFRPTLKFSTDLHRSSQIYLAIHPLFIHFLPLTLSPRSSQIFYRSFKDLSKISLPSSPFTGTWTVGHSGPLFRSPSFSFPPFFDLRPAYRG